MKTRDALAAATELARREVADPLQENLKRGAERRTHCRRGHPYKGNTRPGSRGSRDCLDCMAIRQKARSARRRSRSLAGETQ